MIKIKIFIIVIILSLLIGLKFFNLTKKNEFDNNESYLSKEIKIVKKLCKPILEKECKEISGTGINDKCKLDDIKREAYTVEAYCEKKSDNLSIFDLIIHYDNGKREIGNGYVSK